MVETVSTAERPPSKTRDQVIIEAKRLEESTLYSCKGHHQASQGWKNWHLMLGLPTVVISTLVAAAEPAKDIPYVATAAILLAVVVPILSGITTFLNPNEKLAAHLAAAHAYDRLNNAARMFWSIDCWAADATDEGLTSQLRTLIAEKDELNKASPQIPHSAYKKAKRGIEEGEASFKVDALPPRR